MGADGVPRLQSVADTACHFNRENAKFVTEIPLETGSRQLDELLDGGLYVRLYVLGAAPGMGKSTLALNLARELADRGTPVLYFSLEMPKHLVTAKVISAHIAQERHRGGRGLKGPGVFGATELIRGDRWGVGGVADRALLFGEEQCKVIDDAAQWMDGGRSDAPAKDAASGPRRGRRGKLPLYVVDNASGTITAKTIRAVTQGYIDEHPKGPRPVVMVDYLQILRVEDELSRLTDKQRVDANIDAHLAMRTDLRTPVLVISSFNRSAYANRASGEVTKGAKGAKAATVTLASFKESGGIEYSADVMLGLQLRAVHKSGFDEAVEVRRVPRELELVMLKNRYGRNGAQLDVNFYANCDYFDFALGTVSEQFKTDHQGKPVRRLFGARPGRAARADEE